MLYLSYLSFSQLFENLLSARLEILNELFFLFLCYHMVLFANLVAEFEVRESIGSSFIYCSLIMVGINFIIIIGLNVLMLLRKCRKSYLLKKQKKLIEQA